MQLLSLWGAGLDDLSRHGEEDVRCVRAGSMPGRWVSMYAGDGDGTCRPFLRFLNLFPCTDRAFVSRSVEGGYCGGPRWTALFLFPFTLLSSHHSILSPPLPVLYHSTTLSLPPFLPFPLSLYFSVCWVSSSSLGEGAYACLMVAQWVVFAASCSPPHHHGRESIVGTAGCALG